MSILYTSTFYTLDCGQIMAQLGKGGVMKYGIICWAWISSGNVLGWYSLLAKLNQIYYIWSYASTDYSDKITPYCLLVRC